MTIWKTPLTLEELKKKYSTSMVSHLGIEFLEVGEDFLKARMPVDDRTRQPLGILHGGASAALAETVGSIAANYCVELKTHFCVGLDINTSHIKMISEGHVTAVGRPLHLGRNTQVWEIKGYNEEGRLISQSRLTMLVMER